MNLSTEWIGEQSNQYDGNNHLTTLVIKGLTQTDVNAFSLSTFTISHAIYQHYFIGTDLYIEFIANQVNTYEYSVSCTNNNYIFVTTTFVHNINPIELEVTWQSENNIIYTGQNQLLSVFISGFINNDETTTNLSSLNYRFLMGSSPIAPLLFTNNGVLELRFTIKDVDDYFLISIR